MIELKRTEQSQKGGKERNFWAITFYGLMEVAKYLSNKEIDRVAYRHRDKWLIFAEWPYFLEKGVETIYWFVKRISFFGFNNLQTGVPPSLTIEEMQVRAQPMGFSLKEYEDHHDELRRFLVESKKRECTDLVLGLRSVFGLPAALEKEVSLLPRYILENRLGEKRMLLKSARMTLKLYIDNQRIIEYIDKRFEQEEAEHKLLAEVRTEWEEMKASDSGKV